jgi:sigma-B regulation protein RsbU (phosphoserine phosphatase)
MAHAVRDTAKQPPQGRDADDGLHLTDEVLSLSEAEAVENYLDALNVQRLRRVLWVLAAVFVVYAMSLYAQALLLVGAVANAVVIVDLLLLRSLDHAVRRHAVRQAVAAVLIGHLVALSLIHLTEADALQLWFIVLAMVATRFRMSVGESLSVFGALLGVVAVRLAGGAVLTRSAPPIGELVGHGVVAAVAWLVSWRLSRRAAIRYRSRWKTEADRHRDRLRMKRELEYAREIQLSMLPRRAPSSEWFDVAALSLPATEVGGDYYDYFRLDDDRVVVAVGDVTGHGLASGLVLSGVRSCLNLLQEDLVHPCEVLERVNSMLKRTTAPRMLMTLALVVLNHVRGEATVATAGHPPVLVVRPDGSVIEVGRGSVPLGAFRAVSYHDDVVALAPGDALLVYSDGVVETSDDESNQFGWDRLKTVVSGDDAGVSARSLRDAVLRALWEFKGEAEQIDDVTMVAIRITA